MNKDKLDPVEQLTVNRSSIDNLDAALIHILAERFRKTRNSGEIKAKYNLPISDKERERSQVIELRETAEKCGLDPDFAEKFINFLVAEVLVNHEKIRQKFMLEKNSEE